MSQLQLFLFIWGHHVLVSFELGEMDLDDEVGAGERDKALTSKYGELLLDRFMNFLGSTPEIWKHKAVCIKHDPPTGKPLKRRSNEERVGCACSLLKVVSFSSFGGGRRGGVRSSGSVRHLLGF